MWKQVFSRFRSYWRWLLAIGLPYLAFEIFKDRLAELANRKIDELASANMEWIVPVLDWLSSQPAGWAVLLVVSVLTILFVDSYRVVRDERTNISIGHKPQREMSTEGPTSERAPLLDIYKLAQDKGWDFKSNGSHPAEFAVGLLEAAIEGAIPFWGRLTQSDTNLTRGEPLRLIPTTHWDNYKLDGVSPVRYTTTGNPVGLAEDNMRLMTHNPKIPSSKGSYSDIHVDEAAAINWLETGAGKPPQEIEQSDDTAEWSQGHPLTNPWPNLNRAASWAISQSAWGKWQREQYGSGGSEVHFLQVITGMIASIATEAAVCRNLEIKGRLPDAIEFQPISEAIWRLAGITAVPDKAAIYKFEVIPRGMAVVTEHGIRTSEPYPERVQEVTSYDSLIVNFEQFKSVFNALGPKDGAG